jgi:outer membrane receptor protein involved in Fe transport
VIPAEAFGWGGILQTTIPADDHNYDEVPGIPDTIVNLTAIYTFKNGFSVRVTPYYQGGFSPDRLKTVHVEPVTVMDAGVAYTRGPWEARLNVINVFDETYFNGGSFSSVAARLPRVFDFTLTYNF